MTTIEALENRIRAFRKFPIRTVQIGLDIGLICAAFLLAYVLRFDFSLDSSILARAISQLLWVAPLQFILLRSFNVHKFIWRYISLPEVRSIALALTVSAIPMALLRTAPVSKPEWLAVPLSIIILDIFLATFFILGARLLRRELHEFAGRANRVQPIANERRRVLLIGAGRAGVMTISEIKNRSGFDYDVLGFIDDDPAKLGSMIHGTEVIGTISDLPGLVKKLKIDHVIIAIANSSSDLFQKVFTICRKIPVKVKTIPTLSEILTEKVIVSRIRDIEVEDLLGRAQVSLNDPSTRQFITNRSVMVTGAGGSIGSELVRQILNLKPEKLILVERCEFAQFAIEREIRQTHPEINIATLIGDICDQSRMINIFQTHRPEIIFHAAAHKHVPMMEFNAVEALKNNVLGTNLLGRLAGEFSARAFVLISTDKAVNPSSIMGATKRLAELVIQDLDRTFAGTRYSAVRFGNVIGSNGSVVPIFREQIRKGSPLTVTHPDMKRYFMTISEAAQLVLQSGAIGDGGEIFVLDMGEPVKILDLAKETIRLSGLKPGKDVKIVYTGMRPGEKILEELESDAEQLFKTGYEKIRIAKISGISQNEMDNALKEITKICADYSEDRVREVLGSLLPNALFSAEFRQEPNKSRQNGFSPSKSAAATVSR
ncbi:MAG: polysaccharide biosynthesis protein [Pyrinomonadaceae bacterium]|nr:polysaccharide biosynthesis protein [Pyrinomonadaceae bacterium]